MSTFASILNMIETQFLFSFRTGNVIIDTIITGLIITSTTFLFKSLGNLSYNFDFLFALVGIKYNKVIISGKAVKLSSTNELEKEDYSIKFKAVLHQVKQVGYSKAGVHQLVEGLNTNSELDQLVVAQTTNVTLGEEIHCKIIQESNRETSRDDSNKLNTFKAEISSKTKSIEELESLIKTWVKEYKQFVLETGESQIELTGKLEGGYNQTFDFSNKFLSVLHKINSLNYNLPDIKVLREIQLEEKKDRYASDSQHEDDKRKAESLIPEVCQIDKEVFCKVEWKKTDKDCMDYCIKIWSDVLNVQSLKELLNTWEKEYDEHNQVGDGLKYFVFNPSKESKTEDLYTEFCYESVKSFTNVFFPEKNSLVERIKFFQDNPDWFVERGIPYTLGLLFHGEPGCGKTSTIKAIANMTQRHIISVPLKNVKTTSELYNIFYGKKLNKRSIPMNKRLYVLEDIDCSGLEAIVKRRINRSQKTEDRNDEDEDANNVSELSQDERIMSLQSILTVEQKKNKEKEDKQELTLSDLLEVFDGVMESKVKE